MQVVERSFSDLLRHPNDVTRELEHTDVLLHRRGEPDLRLSRADREADRGDAFLGMARAFRSVAQHSPAILEGAITDAFAWIEFLPVEDRKVFVDEFARIVTAAAELGTLVTLSQLVREWRATAEVWAVPELAANLRAPLQAGGSFVTHPS